MPTPILKIPVDDAAFQRYLATFNKYQEQVAAQPEMWKGINEGMSALTLAGAAIAAEIAHQANETRSLAAEEKKREEAQRKAAKEKADADKDEADRDKQAAARRKHAIDQVKEYSKGLAEAAVNLGKWAIIGEGASLAAGALTFWGLDRFVAGVGEERRLSQGLGVSMGQRQGLGINMQRYFDVNSVLETVTNAQATPSSWGVFRMMGIDPNGKDTAQLTNEAAVAARRMFIADRGNLGLAGAQGLTQIFSPDDLRRLAATPEKDLRQSITDSAANAGLSDEVGRKWQQFNINLETAGLKLKNALIDRLTTLEGPLSDVLAAFTDLALRVLTKTNLDEIATGIEAFAKYIGSPKFQSDFKTFVDDIALIAQKMVDALVFLGVIPDPKAPPPHGATALSGPGTPGGQDDNGVGPVGVGYRAGSDRSFGAYAAYGPVVGPLLWTENQAADLAYGALASGPSADLKASGFSYTSKGEDKRDIDAAKFFMSKGWSPDQAAGIVGYMAGESSNSPNPAGWNDHGEAFGAGQWHKPRQEMFKKLFGHDIQHSTLGEQWAFLNWELSHTFKSVGDRVKRDRDAYTAGGDVAQYLGLGRHPMRDRVTHGKAAAHVRVLIQNQTGSSVATTVNSAAGG